MVISIDNRFVFPFYTTQGEEKVGSTLLSRCPLLKQSLQTIVY